MNARIEALGKFLEIELEEGETYADYLEESSYEEHSYDYGSRSYLVLTDEEADEAAETYIKESLWAFNADFLSSNTGLPASVFVALQEESEDSNEAVLAIVEKCGDLEDLISDAISSDGRGHFLNSYDGNEEEVRGSDDWTYYIVRTN